MKRLLVASISSLVLVAGCAQVGSPDGTNDAPLPHDVQKETVGLAGFQIDNATRIKEVASQKGISNALVYAGVASMESSLAMCWSDATWACQGPYSADCGGPVVAGAGDGPCANEQGGLGLFQLDSGTYAQTIAEHGEAVLTRDGNISAGIDFIIYKVKICPNTPEFGSLDEARQWIEGAKPGTADYQTFVRAIAWCYNGCDPKYCNTDSVAASYDKSIRSLENALGEGFWYGGGSGGQQPAPSTDCADGDGLYCGGNGVNGDPNTLYRCTGGVATVEKVCSGPCERQPDPSPDQCPPDPPPSAPQCASGNGLYCGGNGVNGDPGTLYRCTNGVVTVEQVCDGTCVVMPDGTDDACSAPEPQPGGNDPVSRAEEWVNAGMMYCGGHAGGPDYICGGTCIRTGASSNPEWDPYRSDCSGLVSWAWALPPTGSGGLVTTDFAPFSTAASHTIDASDLQPGDALNNSGHIFLFAGWVDASSGLARVIEEYNCGYPATDHNILLSLQGGPSVYSSWHGASFTAIRKN